MKEAPFLYRSGHISAVYYKVKIEPGNHLKYDPGPVLLFLYQIFVFLFGAKWISPVKDNKKL